MGKEVTPRLELALERVSVTFGGRRGPLFTNINVEARAGEIIGIVGPNGIGKSSLLNVVSLLLPPTKGSMSIVGISVGGLDSVGTRGWKGSARLVAPGDLSRSFQAAPTAEGIAAWRFVSGVGPQAFAALGRMPGRIRAFLLEPTQALVGAAYRQRQREALASASQAFRKLGLDPGLALKPLDSLSLGIRRVADVLRAVGLARRLFVLDEPFAGLRARTALELANHIRERAHRGCAGLLADHNATVLAKVADRVYRLTSTGLVRM